MLARAEGRKVYGAVRESHNERTRNTLKHSTCSHKWRETLKGAIFGVKPFIPSLRRPGGGLVVAPAEKASLPGFQFDSKFCCLSSLSLLSRFYQFRCNSLTFMTSVLLRLLLDLDTYGGVDPLGVFPLFLKKGCGKKRFIKKGCGPVLLVLIITIIQFVYYTAFNLKINLTQWTTYGKTICAADL